MKFKSLLMLGFILILAAACGGKGSAIEKNWTLDDIVFPDTALEAIPEDQREAAKISMREIIDEMRGKMSFDFKSDGKITAEAPDVIDGQTKKSEGTWKLSEDGKALTIEIDGKAENFTVVELSGSKLHIGQENMGMVFIPKKS